MENSLKHLQTQRQEQQLSARQMQSLELLQKPLPALLKELQAELERNPVLEADISGMEILAGDPLSTPDPGDRGENLSGDDDVPDTNDESWQDELPVPPELPTGGNDPQDVMFRTLSGEKTLEQQLLDELAVSGASGKLRDLAELVIGSIDHTGYLRTPPADLAMAADASLEEVMEAVKLVQSFEPAGVGAFTPEECLLLQIERRKNTDPRLAELVRSHLDNIARNKLPQIASAMHITMAELQDLLKELRKLSPYPGSVLAPEHAPYVAPEAEIVALENGSYGVVPGERYIRLRIPARYNDMREDTTLSDEDREYIRDKIEIARELIRALEMRGSTICRIAGVIASEQKDFFDNGPESLRPMTMQQVAERLDLHETTISRAVAGKYVQTPRGVLEFRYFFSTGYESSGGEAVSSRSIQERIRKLIADEDPAKPLSDEAIAKLLAEAGFTVARRTVAKYRDLMHIPGASGRRRHGI